MTTNSANLFDLSGAFTGAVQVPVARTLPSLIQIIDESWKPRVFKLRVGHGSAMGNLYDEIPIPTVALIIVKKP